MKAFADWSIRYKLLSLLLFRKPYRSGNKEPIRAEVMDWVYEKYCVNFYPEMQKLKIARLRPQDYSPVTPAAIQLQYAYIVKNPYPGGRRKMESTGDDSGYGRVHAKYHHAFRKIVEAFGYYDLHLMDYGKRKGEIESWLLHGRLRAVEVFA